MTSKDNESSQLPNILDDYLELSRRDSNAVMSSLSSIDRVRLKRLLKKKKKMSAKKNTPNRDENISDVELLNLSPWLVEVLKQVSGASSRSDIGGMALTEIQSSLNYLGGQS